MYAPLIRGGSMTSEKQEKANRQNALKSIGLKTSEGKAAARHNALKHGLRAEEVLIPGEDEAHTSQS
jgi:hypothetical protein